MNHLVQVVNRQNKILYVWQSSEYTSEVGLRQKIKSIFNKALLEWSAVNKNYISVLLAEINSDEATYKIHQKMSVPESLVNKVADF